MCQREIQWNLRTLHPIVRHLRPENTNKTVMPKADVVACSVEHDSSAMAGRLMLSRNQQPLTDPA